VPCDMVTAVPAADVRAVPSPAEAEAELPATVPRDDETVLSTAEAEAEPPADVPCDEEVVPTTTVDVETEGAAEAAEPDDWLACELCEDDETAPERAVDEALRDALDAAWSEDEPLDTAPRECELDRVAEGPKPVTAVSPAELEPRAVEKARDVPLAGAEDADADEDC